MSKHKTIQEKYEEAKPVLAKEFGIKNVMDLPRIKKISVNMGTGDRLRDKGQKEKLLAEFSAITGQKPKIQPAKKSIAGFSLREGQPVGLTSTLRRGRMYHFLDKVISIVLPRLRDFRGVKTTSFDKVGNYTLGFSEHVVFPEIDLGTVDRPHGMEMTIVIDKSDPEKSKRLLELLGMPFVKDNI